MELPPNTFKAEVAKGLPTEYPPVSLNKEAAAPVLPSEALNHHLAPEGPAYEL